MKFLCERKIEGGITCSQSIGVLFIIYWSRFIPRDFCRANGLISRTCHYWNYLAFKKPKYGLENKNAPNLIINLVPVHFMAVEQGKSFWITYTR
jgi:hypothetical protein